MLPGEVRRKTSPKDWSSDTITGHNTSLTTSRTRSHSSASKHRRVSCVSQKATDAPSGSSVPSKKTSCGLDTSVPSKTCASHSLSFGTDTTTGGSSNVTATRRPNRLETHSRRLERPPEYTHPSVQTTAGFTPRYLVTNLQSNRDGFIQPVECYDSGLRKDRTLYRLRYGCAAWGVRPAYEIRRVSQVRDTRRFYIQDPPREFLWKAR